MSLDDEQQKAVLVPLGPVQIIAGAGTGKTRTLLHRIAYWHLEGSAPAQTVLAVTFTNKSARELRARLSKMGIQGVTAQTFHAAALSQLKRYWELAGKTSKFPELLVGSERYSVLKSCLSRVLRESDLNKKDKRLIDKIVFRAFEEELTRIQSRMIDLDTYQADENASGPGKGITKDEFVSALRKYEEFKKLHNRMDHHDMLIRCARMIESVPNVAKIIHSKYKHILIDEYQDNDPTQERLIKAWLGENASLCVVGDPRQTIFSFKGADASLMNSFAKQHAGTYVTELVKNYRSSSYIVEIANRLMRNTSASGSAKSDLVATKNTQTKPRIRSYYTEEVEIRQTVVRVKHLIDSMKIPAEEIAVLLRYREDVTRFRSALSSAGLPTNKDESEFWKDLDPLIKGLANISSNFELRGLDVVVHVLNELKWLNLGSNDVGNGESGHEDLANLIIDIASSIENISELNAHEIIAALLEMKNLEENAEATAGVNVLTIHKAKGLEWDAVFLPQFVEGKIPSSHAHLPEELDEEQRLAYVGVTRAKTILEISWAESKKLVDRSGKSRIIDQNVSRFEALMKRTSIKSEQMVGLESSEVKKRSTVNSKVENLGTGFTIDPRWKMLEIDDRVGSRFNVDIVLIQVGAFYEAYSYSAQILASSTGYRIYIGKSNANTCGFPAQSLHSTLKSLESQGRKIAVVQQVDKVQGKTHRELRYLTRHNILNSSNLVN
jgi:DNA helicase-2/ATP-dependent DNA helicase PcrA